MIDVSGDLSRALLFVARAQLGNDYIRRKDLDAAEQYHRNRKIRGEGGIEFRR